MQVSVTTTEGLGRRMTVAVPVESIDQEVKTRLKSLADRVRVDGFRPGKAPLNVIEKRFGRQVRDEVNQELVQKTFNQAVVEQQLRPVGQPRIELSRVEQGQPLEFTATFEVYPSVELTIPEGFTIERPAVSVTDADIDTVVDRIRKQNVEWKTVSRAARDGDRVAIDFIGRIDGEPFEGGRAENYRVVLGSKSLVDGFESQLAGSAAGATVTVNVTFPATYPVATLAGKPAQFEVKINEVEEPALPELDESFFAAYGVKDGGVTAFREQVRANIAREVDQAVKTKVKLQVIEVLLAQVKLDLPAVLVESEVMMRMNRTRMQLRQSGVDDKTLKLDRDRFEPSAKRAVAVGLIVSEILRRNNIRVKPEELRSKVEELAAAYDEPQAVVSWYYEDRSRLGDVEAVLLEDHAIDWVLKKARIEDKPSTVLELLDRREDAA